MPKVLIINTGFYPSTGKVARHIAECAVAQGWECYLAVSATSCSIKDKHIIKIGSWVDFYWHALITRLFDKHGLSSSFATRIFIRQIDEIKPDLVHLHNIHGYYLNYQILFSYLKRINVPVVWTLHDCWPFTGHCSYFYMTNCEKWMPENGGCHHCEIKHHYPRSIWKDASQSNYQLKRSAFCGVEKMIIVPVSDWLRGLVQKSYLKEYEIRVVRNGVDINTFKPCESDLKNRLGIEGKTVLLGVATSWTNRKGIKDYYRLSEVLPEHYQIIMLGLTHKQIEQLPAKILGIPRISSGEELAEFYSMADILLSLSYGESFGLTPVEAMACGTPSIVYNNTAQPELITPEVGRIVENGDFDGLCSAIEELVGIGKKKMSTACRKRAVEEYDKDKCFEEYVELYDSMI